MIQMNKLTHASVNICGDDRIWGKTRYGEIDFESISCIDDMYSRSNTIFFIIQISVHSVKIRIL